MYSLVTVGRLFSHIYVHIPFYYFFPIWFSEIYVDKDNVINSCRAFSCIAEVGDYDPEDHPPGYVAQFKMLPKQTAKQEDKIAEIHKSLTQEGG